MHILHAVDTLYDYIFRMLIESRSEWWVSVSDQSVYHLDAKHSQESAQHVLATSLLKVPL